MFQLVPDGPRHIDFPSYNGKRLHPVYIRSIKALLQLHTNALGQDGPEEIMDIVEGFLLDIIVHGLF